MVYRSGGKGTYMVDKRFKGVGRIQKASGTDKAEVHRSIVAMLDELYSFGRLDILTDIKNGVVSVMEVYSHHKTHTLKSVGSVATIRLLDPALFDWVEEYDCAESTRKGYADRFRDLLKSAPNDAAVKDLPEVLQKYKVRCRSAGKRRSFNLCRSAVQSYLRDTLGRHHQLWSEVSNTSPFSGKRKRDGNPQSVAEIRELMAKLPEHHARSVWTMCTTGMGWKEYSGRWEIEGHGIRIYGTKTEGRNRLVPLVDEPVGAATGSRTFQQQIQKVSDGKVTPYDFRRTYANWMERSQIPRTRRMLYLGHSPGDITSLYEYHEVDAFLAEDAERMRTFVRKTPVTNPNAARWFESDPE